MLILRSIYFPYWFYNENNHNLQVYSILIFIVYVEKQAIPNNSNVLTENAGRKRPLLSGECAKVSMTPSKRTVMAILARARTAQVHVKDMVAYSPQFNG